MIWYIKLIQNLIIRFEYSRIHEKEEIDFFGQHFYYQSHGLLIGSGSSDH